MRSVLEVMKRMFTPTYSAILEFSCHLLGNVGPLVDVRMQMLETVVRNESVVNIQWRVRAQTADTHLTTNMWKEGVAHLSTKFLNLLENKPSKSTVACVASKTTTIEHRQILCVT